MRGGGESLVQRVRSAARIAWITATAGICLVWGGCGTTVQKLGTEQLLLSDAVDEAIGTIDFTSLSGERVFLDRTYLQTMQTNNVVDANYVISALRQQMLAAGCRLQDVREEADIIVEPRVGSLGGDGHEVIYGVPQSSAINSAVTLMTQSSMPAFPEIAFGRVAANLAVAKIAVFAYDRQTHQPVWQSGSAKARSSARSTWVLGIGPFQKGTIYRNVNFAGERIGLAQTAKDRESAKPIPFAHEYHFPRPNGATRVADLLDPAVQTAGGQEDAAAPPTPASTQIPSLPPATPPADAGSPR